MNTNDELQQSSLIYPDLLTAHNETIALKGGVSKGDSDGLNWGLIITIILVVVAIIVAVKLLI